MALHDLLEAAAAKYRRSEATAVKYRRLPINNSWNIYYLLSSAETRD